MNTTSPHFWPAEWEQQTATWIAWPHNLETWPDRFEPIPALFVKFIEAISRFQQVHVLSGPAGIEVTAEEHLSNLSGVTIHSVATNDTWIRDYGPTFVTRKADGTLVAVDWQYNAWGDKYPPYDDDARATERIRRIIGCELSASAMYCEGGAIDGNGAGTVMATTSCLLSPTRNPGWTRDMVEDELKRQLGIDKILWVDGGGLAGDDTDGHIDQLARFVGPATVVAASSSQPDDPNRQGLERNVGTLREATTRDGIRLNVHTLPTPPPRFIGNKRVPESYCNFLFVEGAVIVPTFRHDPTDQMAIELLGRLIPDRKIIPIDAHELVWGLGAFHCASQHQPAPRPPLAQ